MWNDYIYLLNHICDASNSWNISRCIIYKNSIMKVIM